jgi:hypothetical protein
MSRRALAILLLGAGAALMLAGALTLGGSGDEAPTTTTVQAAVATTTTAVTITTTTITTTTTAATTTTVAAETLEQFVESYRAALDTDDVGFLFDRLHPRVVGIYGSDLCRAWVAREVVGLDNYEIAGEVTGPADEMFTASDGTRFAIADKFSTTITFTIQGQDFETEAGFALVEGVMYWLGTCR